MRQEQFEKDGKNYVRISKLKAKRLFENGQTIFLLPAKMNPYNMWTCLDSISKENEVDFERLVNSFTYYNCLPEVGTYPKFFISEI